MAAPRHVVRDISYAHSAATKAGRAVIRLMENSTGRLRLIRRANGYERDIAAGRDFWEVMAARYGLTLNVVGGALSNIPAEGPLVLIANHPYGILDGLMMGHILAQRRGDFRILANHVFRKATELERVVLPISFEQTREAVALNLATRQECLAHLGRGGAIGVFPGGTVSTGATPFSHPMDPGWRGFTAKMIARSDAAVVPVFFCGHTSRLFQLASHLHVTLRMGLLIKEFRARVDTPVDVAIGQPVDRALLQSMRDPKAVMDFLRRATYELSPTPLRPHAFGFEFEERHRAGAKDGDRHI